MISLSGTLAEVEADARALFPAKPILTPADLHTLQPHKGCSPEACEIEEVRKHEAEQVAVSARQLMTIQDLLSEKVLDKDEIAHLRNQLKDLQAKFTPGSSVLTLPVLTPDERESERVAGVSPSEKLLGEKGAALEADLFNARQALLSEGALVNTLYGYLRQLGEFASEALAGPATDGARLYILGTVALAKAALNKKIDADSSPTAEDAAIQSGGVGERLMPAVLKTALPPVAKVRILPPPINAPTSDDLSGPPNTGETRTSGAVLSKVDGESTKGGHADPAPGGAASFGDSPSPPRRDGTGKEPVMPAVLDASVAPERSAGEDGLDREGHPRADGGAVSEAVRPLEGKETNALLKTGESIATRANKAVESASVDLALIEEGLAIDELAHAFQPNDDVGCAICGRAIPDGECHPVASDLALRDGVTPAVPENGGINPSAANDANAEAYDQEEQGRAAQGAGHPENEAAKQELQRPPYGNKETPSAHLLNRAETDLRGPAAQGTDHPGSTAANEQPVATDAGLAPNIAEEIGNGERAVEVDPPAPVNQCEVPNKGCPKEGIFDEESGGYFCASIHLLVHKEIRRTWAKVAHPELVGKRWRGRPLGSKNKPKVAEAAPPAKQEAAS